MSAPQKFTVGLIQMSMTSHAKENFDRGIAKVEEAAKKGANVVCLPELFRSQYFCQSEDAAFFDLAEPVPGPTTDAISAAAKKLGVVVIAPVFERRAAGIYHNSAAIINADGAMAGFYRKMHIPDDPSYYEKFYFTPGDLGFRAVDSKFGKIATLICWDQWYPEGARLSSLLGANVLFYPTAIGWHPSEKAKYGKAQRESWQIIQRSHAIANGVYVAVANRIGHEKIVPGTEGIEFWGSSFIADPQGVIIAEASVDKEEILVAEIDLHHLETIRRHWPFLRDRRIDAYHEITSRFIDSPKK